MPAENEYDIEDICRIISRIQLDRMIMYLKIIVGIFVDEDMSSYNVFGLGQHPIGLIEELKKLVKTYEVAKKEIELIKERCREYKKTAFISFRKKKKLKQSIMRQINNFREFLSDQFVPLYEKIFTLVFEVSRIFIHNIKEIDIDTLFRGIPLYDDKKEDIRKLMTGRSPVSFLVRRIFNYREYFGDLGMIPDAISTITNHIRDISEMVARLNVGIKRLINRQFYNISLQCDIGKMKLPRKTAAYIISKKILDVYSKVNESFTNYQNNLYKYMRKLVSYNLLTEKQSEELKLLSQNIPISGWNKTVDRVLTEMKDLLRTIICSNHRSALLRNFMGRYGISKPSMYNFYVLVSKIEDDIMRSMYNTYNKLYGAIKELTDRVITIIEKRKRYARQVINIMKDFLYLFLKILFLSNAEEQKIVKTINLIEKTCSNLESLLNMLDPSITSLRSLIIRRIHNILSPIGAKVDELAFITDSVSRIVQLLEGAKKLGDYGKLMGILERLNMEIIGFLNLIRPLELLSNTFRKFYASKQKYGVLVPAVAKFIRRKIGEVRDFEQLRELAGIISVYLSRVDAIYSELTNPLLGSFHRDIVFEALAREKTIPKEYLENKEIEKLLLLTFLYVRDDLLNYIVDFIEQKILVKADAVDLYGWDMTGDMSEAVTLLFYGKGHKNIALLSNNYPPLFVEIKKISQLKPDTIRSLLKFMDLEKYSDEILSTIRNIARQYSEKEEKEGSHNTVPSK